MSYQTANVRPVQNDIYRQSKTELAHHPRRVQFWECARPPRFYRPNFPVSWKLIWAHPDSPAELFSAGLVSPRRW
jgi:hypothetical protein